MANENIGKTPVLKRQSSDVRQLTRRQAEVLYWVKAGKSSTDIGDLLGVSAAVVNEHVKKACERLGVRTRVQAVIIASECKYLETEPSDLRVVTNVDPRIL